MKPITLKMNAFGSYAKETTIEFDKMKSGLYLITGDTGAGKTTIFDAIMVALFGETSGKSEVSESNRSFAKMHSDFVDKKIPSVVELKFSHNGKEYTVTRTQKFSQSKDSEDGFRPYTHEAVLEEPDKNPIKNASSVTKRIIEIIGMDADKFRKVVMLAQGEFKKFLQAKSDEKGKILGELFDSSDYRYYQNLLAQVQKRLKDNREISDKKIAAAMAEFQIPDPQNEDYLIGSPKLVQALDTLVQEDEQEDDRLKNEYDAVDQLLLQRKNEKDLAERINADFEELDKENKKKVELNQQKPEYENLEKQINRFEDALHQVLPKEKACVQNEKALSNLKKTIDDLKKAILDKKQSVAEKEALCQKDQPSKDRIQELSVSIQQIRDSLQDYQTLSENRQKKAEIDQKLEKLASEIASLQAQETQQTKKTQELETLLRSYANVGAELAQCENDCKEWSGKVAFLDDPAKGILARVAKVHNDETIYDNERKKHLDLHNKYMDAWQKYSEMYSRFLNGQAGILAETLGLELTKNGEAICPVCGTHLSGADHLHLTVKQGVVPSEKEVNGAKAEHDKLLEEYKDHEAKLKTAEGVIETNKENIVRNLQIYEPSCDGWDTLQKLDYQENLANTWHENKKKAEAAYQTAVARKVDAEKTEKNLEETKANLKTTQANLVAKQEEQGKLNIQKTTAAATIETLESKLSYHDKADAEEQIRIQEKEKMDLQAIVKRHEDELKAERDLLASKEGSLDANEKNLPSAESAYNQSMEEFKLALEQHHFTDMDEVNTVLSVAEKAGISGEVWIRQQQKKVQDYNTSVKVNLENIRILEQRTAGKARKNLADLSQLVLEGETNKKQKDEARSSHLLLTNQHRSIRDRVKEAKKELADTDAAWTRINRLATVANAQDNTEGGKLSFERYVMGSVFREIMDMANFRLQNMTGGKYEMIHRASVSGKNKQAGFSIDVLDHTTGKERPSETLSGGESFMASLALALGLSDVVQNHEGGVQIDSLFIDEGFGTLDEGVLDKAMEVLKSLTQGNRLVGIISHVSKLESSISDKLIVKGSTQGSTIQPVH